MQYNISISKDLKRGNFKGKYYAFEGIDGSGKSTQLHLIKNYLEQKKLKVVLTSEPRQEGQIQEIIRDALFSKIHIPSHAYQHLYSADRVVNHAQLVGPELEKGSIVLTHRSFWSAVAYGILDLGEEYDFKKAASILISQGIISDYHQFLAPDKTFYLRVSSKHAVQRLSNMEKKKDIYENEKKLAKIVTGYERVVKEFPDEFIIIDAEKSEEEVAKQIIQYL